jgi:hypothetical protein
VRGEDGDQQTDGQCGLVKVLVEMQFVAVAPA